jgi:hypothetical protein
MAADTVPLPAILRGRRRPSSSPRLKDLSMHPLRPAREPEATSGPTASAAALKYTFVFRYQTLVQAVLVPMRLLEGRKVTVE